MVKVEIIPPLIELRVNKESLIFSKDCKYPNSSCALWHLYQVYHLFAGMCTSNTLPGVDYRTTAAKYLKQLSAVLI